MTITLNGIELPQDLEWQDEFDWTPIRQSQDIALSGTLIVAESAQQTGRPITLYGGPNACWVPRSIVVQLYALTQTPENIMTLHYHGTDYSVMWRHQDGPLNAKPVQRVMNPGNDHKYSITLRLMEVG